MNSLPKSLKKAVEFFEKLPSIGPKTAKRLAFYLLRMPQPDLEQFATTINSLKSNTHYCHICYNLTEDNICSICTDKNRDQSIIAIVEDVLDLLSMETGNQYKGTYHVLHGRIDPLNYIGPDDIYIMPLLKRVKDFKTNIQEIILATNPNTEGEATAMYIKKQLEDIGGSYKITRLAYGLPMGADLEYTDYMTLNRAVEGRRDY